MAYTYVIISHSCKVVKYGFCVNVTVVVFVLNILDSDSFSMMEQYDLMRNI